MAHSLLHQISFFDERNLLARNSVLHILRVHTTLVHAPCFTLIFGLAFVLSGSLVEYLGMIK